MRYEVPPDAELYPFYSELEFKTLLAKLQPPPDMPLFATEARIAGTTAPTWPRSIRRSSPRSRASCRRWPGGSASRSRATATQSASRRRGGEGISFARGALAHENVRAALRSIFASESRAAAYDAKRLLHALRAGGVDNARFADDAMIAAHLLDPSRGFADVADAARVLLGFELPDDAAAHADAAFALTGKAREELAERGQLALYEDVEVPLAPVLAKMEGAGVAIDLAELRAIGGEVDAAAERLQRRIYDFAGETFNIGSPQQLGKVLFDKLEIPGGKKTKTGWATGAEVLQGLAREYPICALVLEWREVTKLKNTYIDVIPQLVDARDGRLHTVFNQTATATGRLSSTNPNLQNIPVRGELGRRIRRAFVARDADHALLAADYSQIELRLMAHLSGDEAMRAAFVEGQDIHDFTARQIFNVAPGARSTRTSAGWPRA